MATSLFCMKGTYTKILDSEECFLLLLCCFWLMHILNNKQLLPGICESLKTTIIRQHELCTCNSEKHSSLLLIGMIKDFWLVIGLLRKKIPYANHCIYVVNIITLTLKARISHKEKLKFCNYTIIKSLLTSHVSPKPLSVFKCKSGSTAVTIPA